MENFLEEYSKLLDESKAHLSYQAIATYLNLKELLSSKEKSFIENHLKSCSACKEKFDTVYNEDIELDNDSSAENFNQVEEKTDKEKAKIFRLPNYWRYASAAVILIAVIAIIYLYLNSKDDTILTEDLQNKDSVLVNKGNEDLIEEDSVRQRRIDKPVPDEFIAEDLTIGESFRANRVLDNFINRDVRAETTVQIISPSIEDTINEPINFKWLKAGGSNVFTFFLVDNKNKTLYEKNVHGNEIIYEGKLKPGLYYWKIESDGKLEAVGKFYIK